MLDFAPKMRVLAILYICSVVTASKPCTSYLVSSGDTCDAIAKRSNLAVADIETYNANTWGWLGCGRLQAGIEMCLTSGTPPLPAPVPNAVCGPTKPGTAAPDDYTTLSDLNPCPLNACCDFWGQCGITPEFCTISSSNGVPGCVSNCGSDLANDPTIPQQFSRIGYFESWSTSRPCLNTPLAQIDISEYTHIHWAFVSFDGGYNIITPDQNTQWKTFLALSNVKKIASIGGWTFSTDASTDQLFSKAVSGPNANTFADSIVRFVSANGLDGIDIDWEYPGNPDAPGSASASDGQNLLAFLTQLRSKMPKDKTISIALPASYYYLKQYPVAALAPLLNYTVYMTYDLHGSWDYGSPWSQSGCPNGDCLRSHVNLTETVFALSMLIKAGMPRDLIAVGVTSYGRSFGTSEAGCTGADCHYQGPQSSAVPGECTRNPGTLANGEISDMIRTQHGQTWYDGSSNADIIVFAGPSGTLTQWASYMSEHTKQLRQTLYKSLGFGGSADWALDLRSTSL